MTMVIFVCDLCDKLFSSVDDLKVHKSSSHNDNVRTCAFCSATFEQQCQSLTVEDHFLCPKCQTSQPSIVIKKRSIIEKYVQSKMNKNDDSKNDGEESNDNDATTTSLMCEVCGECLDESAHVCNIREATHPEGGDISDYADIKVSGSSENNMECNIKLKVEDQQDDEDEAEVGINNTGDMDVTPSNNLDNSPMKCIICDKMFKGKNQLNKHLRSHSNLVKKCRICEKEIFLRVNDDISDVENSEIILCDKVCLHCKTIESHLKKLGVTCNFEKDDVSKYSFQFFKKKGLHPCPDCKRVFKRLISLLGHQHKHAPQRTCDKCGLPFFTNHICPPEASAISNIDLELKDLKDKKPSSKSNFTCEICNRVMATKKSLGRHMMTVHMRKYSYYCVVCQIHFYTGKVLINDKFIVDGLLKFVPLGKEKNEIYRNVSRDEYSVDPNNENNNCKVEVLNGENLDGEKRVKKSLEKSSLEDTQGADLKHCRTCHKTFCSQSNLRRHMKTHTRVKSFFCEKCGKRIRGLKAFKNHVCSIEGIHKGSYKGRKPRIKAFNDCYDDETKSTEETMCDVCGKVLSSVASLHKHAITHGAKNHICEQCGKGFHHREYLKEHYIQKHGEGKYKTCPVCQKVLKGRNSYDSHVLRMHPNLKNKDAPPSYICPECGKVFNQKGNMYKHQLSHSTNLNFKCHHCNVSFKYPEQLRRHMLWHNGGPKYECHLCDRKFVLKFQLTKHVNEYHGGVVLTCKYCDVTIKRFVSMKRHLMRKHSKELEWQKNPLLFMKKLATISTHYVNVLPSEDTDNNLLQNVNSKNINSVRKRVNDDDEEDVEDDDTYEIEEKFDESGNGNDECGDGDDDTENNGVKSGRNDDNDHDYHPSPVHKKRRLLTKSKNNIITNRTKIRNSKIPTSNNYHAAKANLSQLLHTSINSISKSSSFTNLKSTCQLVDTISSDKMTKTSAVSSKLTNFRQNYCFNKNAITNSGDGNIYSGNENCTDHRTSSANKILLLNKSDSAVMVPNNKSIADDNLYLFDNSVSSHVEVIETQFIPETEVVIVTTNR